MGEIGRETEHTEIPEPDWERVPEREPVEAPPPPEREPAPAPEREREKVPA